jgi:uncharacterized SAM-binding protein YcdF (DUF218 family)
VNPTKLNEYLVLGIPVVATDLPEIRRFNAEHGDVVGIAAAAEAYADAIKAAIASPSPPTVAARRIEVAESNSWERRLEQMSALIESELEAKAVKTAGWEQRIRRLYGAAKTGPAKVVGGLLLAYALVFHSNLIWWLAEPLKISEPARPSDAIVVFAGGVGESGRAGGGVQERISQAITLYNAGIAPHVIISSGFVFTSREAEQMKTLAVAKGVPADAIILEEAAANTYQNVVLTRDILVANGWRRIALVSSPYHMRRAMLTWRKSAPGIEVTATPPPNSIFYAHERGASLEQIRSLMQEYAGIVYYWWVGRI